jgi:hypothetical protein
MDDLIAELNTRYEYATSRGDEHFIYGICNYLDLFSHPEIRAVLEKQKNVPSEHYHHFLSQYQKLVAEVYEPVRNNPSSVPRKFYSFFHQAQSAPLIFYMVNVLGWKAMLWDRPTYKERLKGVHEHVVLALKNKLLLEVPTTAIQPSKFLKLRSALNVIPTTKWQNITLKFSNEYDVEIFHGSKSYKSNHEELGFQDKRGEAKPKLSWNFLKVLSINKGEYPMQQFIGNERVNKSKEKQALAAQLRTIFGIEDEPFELFFPTSTSYKIKLNLTPEQTFRPDFRDRDIFSDDD